MNADTTFAAEYEVLLYVDTECKYIGQNQNGDYVLSTLSKKLPLAEYLYLYFISPPSSLLTYFKGKKSMFTLGMEATKIYLVQKNCLGDEIDSK